jgi:FAD/FMN-containing dehydrogenases
MLSIDRLPPLRWSHREAADCSRPQRQTLLVLTILIAGCALQESEDNCFSGRTAVVHCDASRGHDFSSAGVAFETGQSLTNWSSTHSCQPFRLYEPSNAQEVCRVLEEHHTAKHKIRPVGTGLSPNGIGMTEGSNTDLISVAALDYIEVDKSRKLVTVGAGARVAEVLNVNIFLILQTPPLSMLMQCALCNCLLRVYRNCGKMD